MSFTGKNQWYKFVKGKTGDDYTCQEQMLQRYKSFVECDTKNKFLTQQFSGILKLGAQILHRLSLEESVGSGIQWKCRSVS